MSLLTLGPHGDLRLAVWHPVIAAAVCKQQWLPQASLLVCPPLSVPDTHALSGAAGRSELVKSTAFFSGASQPREEGAVCTRKSGPTDGCEVVVPSQPRGLQGPCVSPAGVMEEMLKSHVRSEQLWPILGPHAEEVVLLPPSYFQPSLQGQPMPSGTSPSDAADAK